MQRSCNWVFTVHNWTDDDVSVLKSLKSNYLLFGEEVCPSTGTPHLQGYVQLVSRSRRTELVKKLSCFWEVARGSPDSQSVYCKKDGTYTEIGTPVFPRLGKGQPTMSSRVARNRVLRDQPLCTLVDGGVLGILQVRTLKNCRLDLASEVQRSSVAELDCGSTLPNVWYWGPAGSGKSRRARDENPGFFDKSLNQWWDGYAGEKVVIVDDVDKEHASLCHLLKRWADRYPFPADVKNSSSYIRPSKIVVTSNYHPREIWCEAVRLDAILRRFSVVYVPMPVVDTE